MFNDQILNMKDDMVSSLQEILKFKSVEAPAEGNMPFGKEVHDCLMYALNLSEKLGFKTKNVDNYAGHAEIGQGDEIIGVLVHLDVVPEGDDWDYDPYGGQVVDGKIFGRGTLDDKGPAIATLYAMKALVDSGVQLNKRIRIIFGTNEETHWKGINYYLQHEATPDLAFTPDADFPACHGEKGIIFFDVQKQFEKSSDDGGIKILSIKGGNAPNMVPDHVEAKIIENINIDDHVQSYNNNEGANLSLQREEGFTRILSKGISAHGSTPEVGVNAISHLLTFMNSLDLQKGDVQDFIQYYNNTIGMDYNGQRAGCNFEDEESGKLTYNVGTIDLNEESMKMRINIRYPITTPYEDVNKGIRSIFTDNNFEYNLEEHMGPIYFPKDHELIVKLMKVYRDHTGDMSEPLTMGGGTYARAMKNAVAFGGMFPGDEQLAHQKNEYVKIDSFIKSSQIYASALYELAK